MKKISGQTKERIIIESAKLFARESYSTVSIKSIAEKIGIKTSSIYNHFASKEDILETILLRFRDNYIWYFENQKETVAQENTVEGIMDIMFASLRKIDNEFMYCGMTIIMKEQFHNKLAKELAAKLFYSDSIAYMKASFDLMVEKKMIASCDSKAIATFFMFSVLVGTQLRIQESVDEDFSVNIDDIYQSLYDFIIDVLQHKPKAQ